MAASYVDFKKGQEPLEFTPDISINTSYITDCTLQSMSFGKIKVIYDYLTDDIKLIESTYESIQSKGKVFESRDSYYDYQYARSALRNIQGIMKELYEINLKEMINQYNTNLERGKSKWCARRTNQIIDEINERNEGKGVIVSWEWDDKTSHATWHYVYEKILERSVTVPGTLQKWYDQDVIKKLERSPYNITGFESWLSGSMRRPSDTGE